MINSFLDFFDISEGFESNNIAEDFCRQFSERSFGDGLYNTFSYEKRDYWNSIVEKYFGMKKGDISVIGYDWMGRISAVYRNEDCVRIFEIGTGEVLNTGSSVEAFLNEEIPVYPDDSLAQKFYREWVKNNPSPIPYGSCVGYKIPLFLGGKDEVTNLELSDIDVYWNVVGPLLVRN